ncbi:class F sortase [Actinotalea sp.]|uniref:class F sortase n=1 Tax=Actinotalea sp. TaxID=1872145 RepID=UPI00356698C4
MKRIARSTAAGLLATLLLLGACSTPATEQAAPSAPSPTAAAPAPAPAGPAPEPSPAPSSDLLPVVPVRNAALDAVARTERPAPVRVTVPSLGIDVPVDPVGIQDDGQMEIPPMAERAGWYRFGSAPGDASGTSVIAAHVDSIASAGLGPFARLRDLAVGSEVTVDLGDGATARYTVDEVRRVPKTDVAWNQVFVRDGAPQLALITCGGTWQPEVRHYSDNVIVLASPVR